MNFIELDISLVVIEYFAANHKHLHDLEISNGLLENECGIKTFFESSDLKNTQTNSYRKLTIVTQGKIGQETNFIKQDFSLTYGYLNKNSDCFVKRKSSIYHGKPRFSIFGVGDYFSRFKKVDYKRYINAN
jgi:hypothetical protein